jgi:hypothetical protein
MECSFSSEICHCVLNGICTAEKLAAWIHIIVCFVLIHLSFLFQSLNWKEVECGNIILVEDSGDEKHLLLRPIESVSQEEFYSTMKNVLKGEKENRR